MGSTNKRNERNDRLGEEKLNNQGCLMRIVEYNGFNNLVVEFQDEHKAKVRAIYTHFLSGEVKNPFAISVCGVGVIGNKYKTKEQSVTLKEYTTWKNMLKRSFDQDYEEKFPTYKDVTCCKEWLNYENFYEWLHNQPNFDKWLSGDKWCLDKDILVKGNKIYSPDTCCLVPNKVNSLFVNKKTQRGSLPIGVRKNGNGFSASCSNPFTKTVERLGTYKTKEESFLKYKIRKEYIIKRMAQLEYNKGNITKCCYEAMINYKVEITD